MRWRTLNKRKARALRQRQIASLVWEFIARNPHLLGDDVKLSLAEVSPDFKKRVGVHFDG